MKLLPDEFGSTELIQLASPETCMPFVNNQLVNVKDKRGNMWACAVNYSSTGRSYLFTVNLKTGKAERHRLMSEKGAYAVAPGANGCVYLGTFTGRLWNFDFEKRRFCEVGRPFPGEYIWGGGSSSRGCVYIGTYPKASFAEYDTLKGEFTFITRSPVSDAMYARGFTELPDGRICVSVGGPNASFLLYNPSERSLVKKRPRCLIGKTFASSYVIDKETLLVNTLYNTDKIHLLNTTSLEEMKTVPIPQGELMISRVAVSDDVFSVGLPSGRIYRLVELEYWEPIGEETPRDSTILARDPEGGVMGVTPDGLFFRCNPRRKEYFQTQLPSSYTRGMIVMTLAKGREGEVFGATYINQHIFRFDYKENISTDLGRITRIPGEVCNMLFLREKLYLASYVLAEIYVYDPEKPVKINANPRFIGRCGEDQNRPTGIATDGEKIFIGTHARYGDLGGAVTIFDPNTEAIKCYRHVVPDQNVNSVVYDASSGLIFGGVAIYGEAHPPTERSAQIFALDPKNGEVMYRGAPWQAPSLRVWTSLPDGRILGGSGESYFIFNSSKMDFTAKGSFPLRPIGQLVLGSDGRLYGFASTGFFWWELDKDRVQKLSSENGTNLIEVEPGLFIYSVDSDLRMIKLRHPSVGRKL